MTKTQAWQASYTPEVMLMSMGAASSSMARQMSMTASLSASLVAQGNLNIIHWSMTSSRHSSVPSTMPVAGSSVCRHVSGATWDIQRDNHSSLQAAS